MPRPTPYDRSYNHAVGTTEPYRGTPHTVETMVRLVRGDRGEKSIRVRRHTEQIIGGLRAKDYSSEVASINYWWAQHGRYTRDPVHVEMLRDPERLVEDAQRGKLALDCDEYAIAIGCSCLCIGAEIEFVTVSFRPAPAPHSHVFVRSKDPRTGIWWVLDPVAGRKTAEMLARVRNYRIYRLP